MKQSWYEIRNAAEEAEVFIYDEIGWFGITAGDFVKEVKAITAPVIALHINSPGGDVFDGMAIYNTLKNHPASVKVIVDGVAASTASFITQAGDKVSMATGSAMMIHEPYGMVVGSAQDMARMAETLGKIGDTIAGIYAGRAGGTEADWRGRMEAETWYRAQEAVDAGLADAVLGSNGKASALAPLRVFNLAKFRHVPDWVPIRNATPSREDFKGTPFADLPVDEEEDWNPNGAPDSELMAAILGPGGDNWAAYKKANLAYAPGEDFGGDPPTQYNAYKLKVARRYPATDPNGTLKVNFNQLANRVAVLNGARGGADLTEGAREQAYNHAVKYYRKVDREPPPLDSLGLDVLTQTLIPPLAEAAGYQAPIPSLKRLLFEHPLELGG